MLAILAYLSLKQILQYLVLQHSGKVIPADTNYFNEYTSTSTIYFERGIIAKQL